MVHCFTYETGEYVACGDKQRKQPEMSEFIWETFDGLFKTVHRQGQRVEELEARLSELEQRLGETVLTKEKQPAAQPFAVNEMPAERAA